ncbi:Tub family-domain-containing protein [Blastocladiella britannica]|nr:Tub family-domain-containing protein [Blastocladiella britannica]
MDQGDNGINIDDDEDDNRGPPIAPLDFDHVFGGGPPPPPPPPPLLRGHIHRHNDDNATSLGGDSFTEDDDPDANDDRLLLSSLLGDGTSHLPPDRSPEAILHYLQSPIPQGAIMQCRIFRFRDRAYKFSPGYEVYLEDGQQQIFLMSARKKPATQSAPGRGSSYTVSVARLHAATPADAIAKVRSNFLGTAFAITAPVSASDPAVARAARASAKLAATTSAAAVGSSSSGKGASDQQQNSTDNNDARTVGTWWQGKSRKRSAEVKWHEELGAVLYEPNLLGFKGPRKMTILLPTMSMNGTRLPMIPTTDRETLLGQLKANDESSMLKLYNKSPQWNDETHSYVLNFQGRITVASVKNFQVVHDYDLDLILLQFGRADDCFAMDAQYPMTPLQAFGICLTSFDAKLACE